MKAPSGTWRVVKTFEKRGFRAWLVGGAVRDFLQGKVPRDLDVLTCAGEEDICSLLPGALRIGRKGGVSFLVTMDGWKSEITSTGGKSLVEELGRRDFTVNAMAMGQDGTIIDPFDGRKDLEGNLLRFTGDPLKRLQEDPVRAIRFCRFASILGMRTEEKACHVIRKFSRTLPAASPQRVGREILLSAESRSLTAFFTLARDLGLADIYDFSPPAGEDSPSRRDRVQLGEHVMEPLGELEKKECHPRLTLAMFYLLEIAGNAGKWEPEAFPPAKLSVLREHMEACAWPRDMVRDILQICRYTAVLMGDCPDRSLFSLLEAPEEDVREDAFTLAKFLSSRLGKDIRIQQERKERLLRMKKNMFREDLVLTGSEIIRALGCDPGPEIGRIKREITFLVAMGKIRSREQSLEKAREIMTS